MITYADLENSDNNTKVMEFCQEYGGTVISSIPYQICEYMQLISALVSIYTLPYTFCKHINPTPLHKNIKLLLISFFLDLMLFTLTVTIGLIYQQFLIYTAESSCKVFPRKIPYAIINILECFTLQFMLLSQTSMWVERAIATIYVEKYEKTGLLLGAALCVTNISVPAFTTWLAFRFERFEEVQVNSFMSPKSTAPVIGSMFPIGFSLSILSVTIMYMLNWINVQRINKHKTLSSRYQATENATTTCYIAQISFCIFCGCFIYAVGIMALQNFVNPKDTLLSWTIREAVHVIPLFCVILSFQSSHLLKKMRFKRASSIGTTVAMKSTGEEGHTNYANMLNQQWA